MSTQLPFDWPPHVRMGHEDFFVSTANVDAYKFVTNPNLWPDHKLAVSGPSGSGKTHLAKVFAEQVGAEILNANNLSQQTDLPNHPIVVEDGERITPEHEQWLFHAHNHLNRLGISLLLTGLEPPQRWPVALPDLKSRLSATTCVAITDPDDALLDAVVMKLFQDRQIQPTPSAFTTLRSRMDRSFEAAHHLVNELDKIALQEQRAVTSKLVREVLENIDDPEQ